MNKYWLALPACAFVMIAAAAASPATAPLPAHASAVDRVDPPWWWAGMRDGRVQLLLHGAGIAALDASLATPYPGVRIAAVTRVASDNYLFVDLELAPDVHPGTLPLRLGCRRPTMSTAHTASSPAASSAPPQCAAAPVVIDYPLLARTSGSAQRAGFGSADVIYEVMPDRFANGDPSNDQAAGMRERPDRQDGSGRHGGDLQGIIDHLDYIAGMGYTTLWPTPLLESDMPHGSYHGYASTDHYRIDPRYGSNALYRRMVAQAGARGIKVIQDVVLNHVGSEHWWLRDPPSPDWLTYDGKFVPTAHHRVALQDPYGSAQDRRNFTAGWFAASMPDLNQANPLLATYLVQNSIWWIEYAGLAGLRVDTYGYSDPAFLTQWSGRLMAEYPRLNLVGEEWSTLIPVVAHWQRGKHNANGYVSHMPSMMDFPLASALRRALASDNADNNVGDSLTTLYETLSQDDVYPDPGQLVLFEGNHDLARSFSALNGDPDLFRMAAAFVLTAPRIPQFYSGSELLMTSTVKGRDDASYRRDFPGGWPGDAVNGFTGSGLEPPQLAAQTYLKRLLNWRKSAAVIHHGKTMQFGPEQDTYVYFRYDGTARVMVVLNKNRAAFNLPLARFGEMLEGRRAGVDVASGVRYPLDGATLTLPARSALILELE